LIETMRREGYEFHVSRPEVILQTSPSGQILEPFEEVRIEVHSDDIGVVMESLNNRQGKLQDMKDSSTGTVLLTFLAPTRGILGFRHHFLTMTRGTGVLNTTFDSYAPQAGSVEIRSHGSLVAYETGTATTFGLKNAEERGVLFIEPGMEVYHGMVVGENKRPDDIAFRNISPTTYQAGGIYTGHTSERANRVFPNRLPRARSSLPNRIHLASAAYPSVNILLCG